MPMINPIPPRTTQQKKHGEQIKRAYNKGGEALANKEAAKKKAVHGIKSVTPGEVSRIKSDKAELQIKSEKIQEKLRSEYLKSLISKQPKNIQLNPGSKPLELESPAAYYKGP